MLFLWFRCQGDAHFMQICVESNYNLFCPRFPPHGHIVSTGPGGILYETNTIAADDYQHDRIVILTEWHDQNTGYLRLFSQFVNKQDSTASNQHNREKNLGICHLIISDLICLSELRVDFLSFSKSCNISHVLLCTLIKLQLVYHPSGITNSNICGETVIQSSSRQCEETKYNGVNVLNLLSFLFVCPIVSDCPHWLCHCDLSEEITNITITEQNHTQSHHKQFKQFHYCCCWLAILIWVFHCIQFKLPCSFELVFCKFNVSGSKHQ